MIFHYWHVGPLFVLLLLIGGALLLAESTDARRIIGVALLVFALFTLCGCAEAPARPDAEPGFCARHVAGCAIVGGAIVIGTAVAVSAALDDDDKAPSHHLSCSSTGNRVRCTPP